MPRRVHMNSLPLTPCGVHRCFNNVLAEEIEIDDQITIKSSLCRETPVITKLSFKNVENEPPSSLRSPNRSIHSTLTPAEVFANELFDQPKLITESLISKTEKSESFSLDKPSSSFLFDTKDSELASTGQPKPTLNSFYQDDTKDPQSTSVEQSESTLNLPPFIDTNKPESTASDQPKSVSEFSLLVEKEEQRLTTTNATWKAILEESDEAIPEVAFDSIRLVVGKCNLLLSKKFPFCKQLIEVARGTSASLNDLLGHWDICANEIQLIDESFERLRCWRDVHDWKVEQRPITPLRFQQGRPLIKKRISSTKISKISKKILANRNVTSNFARFRAQKKFSRISPVNVAAPEKWAVPTMLPISARSRLVRSHGKRVSTSGKKSNISYGLTHEGVTNSTIESPYPCGNLRLVTPFRRPATGTPIPVVRSRLACFTPTPILTENIFKKMHKENSPTD